MATLPPAEALRARAPMLLLMVVLSLLAPLLLVLLLPL